MFEGFGGGGGGEDPFAQMRGEGGRAGHARRPQAQATGDHLETSVTITLEEAYRGTTRRLAFQRSDGAGGAGGAARQDYDVKIPAGIREGQKVRLKGQGGGTQVGGYGDILITIHLAADARYQLEGDDLVAELALTPWEAALGARVTVTTLDGPLEVKVPAAIRSGQRMRVRGRGWPKKGGEKGDLLLRVAIQVPPKLTTQEQELFEKLKVVSSFNPRE
jgi:curved DNA-binding protein